LGPEFKRAGRNGKLRIFPLPSFAHGAWEKGGGSFVIDGQASGGGSAKHHNFWSWLLDAFASASSDCACCSLIDLADFDPARKPIIKCSQIEMGNEKGNDTQ
jgi:hypothetical protein